MYKRANTVEELVEFLEPGGLIVSSTGAIAFGDPNRGSTLAVTRPGNPNLLWVDAEDNMDALMTAGPFAVLSRAEVIELFNKSR